nr:uncharacterized protein LOC129155100 isoform X2 [Nothobranchius furzeri]
MQRGRGRRPVEPLEPAGPEKQSDGSEDEGAAGPAVVEAEGSREPTLTDLVGILQAHMSQQTAQNHMLMEEARRQDRRFQELQQQFRHLQEELQPHPLRKSDSEELEQGDEEQVAEGLKTISSPGQCRSFSEPRLEKLTDTDDIEHFLITFERIAASCNWPMADWVFHLVPLLTGKARSAYVHMDIEERFRSTEVEAGETPKELYVRLKELYDKWIHPQGKTVKDIGEMIVLEQFLRMLPPELQVWVQEHDPPSASKAASLAEVFVAARRKGQPWSYTAWKTSKEKDNRRTPYGQPQFQSAMATAGKGPSRDLRPDGVFPKQYKEPICYLCGLPGHTKPMCPKNTAKTTQLCVVPAKGKENLKGALPLQVTKVEVNGRSVEALIDTGSVQTLVERTLVPYSLVNVLDTIPIQCVHGDKRRYPTADLYIKVQGQVHLLRVGVLNSLPFPVVLGSDLPILFDLIQAPLNCAVVTRSQVRQKEETLLPLSALPFFDAELDVQPGKLRKSRQQRRREKFLHTARMSKEDLIEVPQGFTMPSRMAQMQQDDPELSELIQRARGDESGEHKGCAEYVLQDDILYRQQGVQRQLVVPQEAREMVLELGHAIPWAGHLGKQKTWARIKRHFYWPGLRSDVAQFCKTCPECQLASNQCPPKVPLQPLPLINTPFERLGMDMVGPLEKSKTGYRYMLVITDYATRYPEVFPLKTMKAKAVALSLVQLFSRVGFPREIVTDQGTNFMSTLLQQVYQLLGIKGIRTTPYHPQTDGLTERFNQTLKQMLRKFVDETGSDWDQWLPYLLFAYREVPQASTGFSPFELLYGHEVRGPLALLKETWTGEERGEGPVNVISYVLQMRERLLKMTTLAQQHLAEAQRYQKRWYDKSARERDFLPGQKVLVMLPTRESKLLAKWQGPYEVVKRLGPTTYEVCDPCRSRSKRVLHVNLLKEWTPRSVTGAGVMLIRAVAEEEDVDDQYMPSPSSTVCNLSHLIMEQQNQIKMVCHPQVFAEYPGRTDILEHNIVLKRDAVAKRMSYRIPERLLGSLKAEVELMQSLGIIEDSKSEWCNPVVLVPKKEEGICFCIDFRYLNSVSKFDAYPTLRIDDVINRLGKSMFLSTLDLCKGYWQVPLSQESREFTAFRTPWGLFQFAVLPFGLHGAPATFQRLMDEVLRGCEDYACAYLDDIVIFSRSWEDHMKHLQSILSRLRDAGLTVNPSKCVLARREVEYLGFRVGDGVVKPLVAKVQALESCQTPRTKKQLRSFLGLAGYYHRFIPHFSSRAALLTDMTGSKYPNVIQWTEKAMAAYRDMQHALGKESVLKCPDFDEPFVLQTDASDRGIGAVLLQGHENLHPVAFISRKLFPREVKYSTVEKEALAIKWALDSLKFYLLGREFTLQTDHKALQWLHRMRDTNSRVTRWALALQPFRFLVQHVPGKANMTADYLSRWSGVAS